MVIALYWFHVLTVYIACAIFVNENVKDYRSTSLEMQFEKNILLSFDFLLFVFRLVMLSC